MAENDETIDFDARKQRIQEIVEDVARRRAAGEAVRDEDVIAQHQDLMPDIEERLKNLDAIAKALGDPAGAQPKSGHEQKIDQPDGAVHAPDDSLGGYRIVDLHSKDDMDVPLSAEERVDRICDQFEMDHNKGAQPSIEDYLGQALDIAQDHLLRELIVLEIDLQCQAGKIPDIEDYRQRFSNRLAVIEAAWKLAGSQRADLEPEVGHEMPEQIGRYTVERELGRGGFAVVYLAHDAELNRQVALKVPRADRFRGEQDIERFVEEARHAASLDHPGIVRVHDVQRDVDSVYIVQQYVPGQDLGTYAKNHRFSPREIAELLVDIADAVGLAHRAGIYHRDLKLANILIDQNRRPHVADFGLAVHVSRQHEHRGELAGSYPYMAPEQVRGEVHRLDGRTDIWALGVIFYELLTHTRPFQGQERAHLLDEIEHRDPRPPRQIDPTVPRELSRICQACLAKRAADRYESTTDLIEDLQHWLDVDAAKPSEPSEQAAQPQPRPQPKIVPKGLRSFDASDADFFLELLPGPRDRDGLPKSIRFWKNRIEVTSPEQSFPVGLMYGPSGCGKSSLVQAGLLPRLAEHVVSVYVDATAADTEVRLLKSLRRQCPELAAEASLPELLTTLRDHGAAGGKKVLIVLDQFEQWLHSHAAEDQGQLVSALRQCDGSNVQALVLVRADYYLGVNRFFQSLEESLLEGHNQALVDLFDPDHAKKVLTAFGRAYGRLPETKLSAEQIAFLDAAVTGLAEEGNVVSVRLAVFAEMMKGKSWTQASLGDVGGTEGIGFTFLEETFAARTSPPNYRLHQKGIRAVLNALLPEPGTVIKGRMRTYEQLLEVSKYEARPTNFEALLGILDREVRLITPTEPDESDENGDLQTEPSAKFYQLSHDYLVPSLRHWLRQKETESYGGRARIRLADRAALWKAKPEDQQLPAWWEYLNILALTRKRDWTQTQRRMMAAARWYFATRAAALAVLVALLAWGGREMYARYNSSALVSTLINAEESKVLSIVDDLQPYIPWARESLQRLAAMKPKTPDETRQQLHARLALVGTDETQVPALKESLLTASPGYVGVIRAALRPYKERITEDLWQELHVKNGAVSRRFRAGMALANYVSASEKWKDDDHQFLAEQLLLENPKDQPVWLRYVEPISDHCLRQWEQLFSDANASETHLGAANALAEFAADDQERIARLLAVANRKQYQILFPLIASSPDAAAKRSLAKIAAELPADDLSSADRVPFGQRRAGAGITLLRLGEQESVLPTFDMTDDPEALTQFIHRCLDRGVRAEELLECLELASSSLQPPASSLTRYALLLALGEYPFSDIPEAERDSLIKQLGDWYQHDPSSAVHGATGWLLRQWGQDEIVQRVDQTPVSYSPDREWFTLAITVKSPRRARPGEAEQSDKEPEFVPQTFYLTFIVFPAGEYHIGSMSDETDHGSYERRQEVKITRPFALLDRELTLAELIVFDRLYADFMKQFEREPVDAGYGIDWYSSANFCRWFTEQAGFLEEDQAYPDPASLDMKQFPREQYTLANWAPRNWPVRLDRRGFRLPMEAEWELACRAGMRTMYGQGSDIGLLSHYAWYWENSEKHVHPPKTRRPGLRGLFDMHGNSYEWCHDWNGGYGTDAALDGTGPDTGSRRVTRGGSWNYSAASCRSSNRGSHDPTYRDYVLGIRLALVPSSKDAERQESSDSPPAEARRERSGAATEGAVADDGGG